MSPELIEAATEALEALEAEREVESHRAFVSESHQLMQAARNGRFNEFAARRQERLEQEFAAILETRANAPGTVG